MQFDSLNHFKLVMTSRIFVQTADENYIQARWLFLNGFSSFHWQAAQAIEKYLKAGLVLNGLSFSKGTHNLTSLFDDYCKTYNELAPGKFILPEGFPAEFWHQKEASELVFQIDRMGHADSRYGLTNWTMFACDLVMLDLICWQLRRLVIGLDWVIGDDFVPSPSTTRFEGQTFKFALTKCPNAVPLSDIRGLDTPVLNLGERRSQVLSAWNFSNFEGEKIHETPVPPGMTSPLGKSANSYIQLLLNYLNKTDDSGRLKKLPTAIQNGVHWLIENVKLDPKTKKELARLRSAKRY